MKRLALVVLILLVCSIDGYVHYREEQEILELEWVRDVTILQKDMLSLELNRKCK